MVLRYLYVNICVHINTICKCRFLLFMCIWFQGWQLCIIQPNRNLIPGKGQLGKSSGFIEDMFWAFGLEFFTFSVHNVYIWSIHNQSSCILFFTRPFIIFLLSLNSPVLLLWLQALLFFFPHDPWLGRLSTETFRRVLNFSFPFISAWVFCHISISSLNSIVMVCIVFIISFSPSLISSTDR